MITHYLPQWLLKRFGAPVLELDIHTGRVAPRSVRRAGSGEDLWSEETERALMGTHDNDAARVFRYHIDGARRIVLPEAERQTLARWLALFMPRVPAAFGGVTSYLQQAKDDPQVAVNLLYERPHEIIALIRRDNASIYDQTVEVLGTYAGEAFLLAGIANGIRRGTVKYLPEARDVYDVYLNASKIHAFANMLCEYHWTWLYSPHGFVIGDNPLVRWHALSQRWNFGIARGNVEITMPLGTHLCLRLRRRRERDHGQVMLCPRAMTTEYNRRQRLAAIAHVYAVAEGLLREVAAPRLDKPKRAVLKGDRRSE